MFLFVEIVNGLSKDFLLLDLPGDSDGGSVANTYGALLTSEGKTFDLVGGPAFSLLTTEDFQTYGAIIFPDSLGANYEPCGPVMELTVACAIKQRWSEAITGNIVLIGSDENNHWSRMNNNGEMNVGSKLAKSSLLYAGAITGKTGFYMSFGHYYQDAPPGTPVHILSEIGNFTVSGVPAGCYDDAHIVVETTNTAIAGLTDSILSNWICSVHVVFMTAPATFIPLAIGRNVVVPGSLTFADGSFGVPYILASGAISPVNCGNGILETGEGCDDGNTNSGDGCSDKCQIGPCYNCPTPGEILIIAFLLFFECNSIHLYLCILTGNLCLYKCLSGEFCDVLVNKCGKKCLMLC